MTEEKCNFTNFNSNEFKFRRPHVLLDSVALEEDNVFSDSNYLYNFSYICQTFHQKLLGEFWLRWTKKVEFTLPSETTKR